MGEGRGGAVGERERACVSVRVCDRHRLLSVWLQLYSATTRQQLIQIQQQVGTLDFCAFPAAVSACVAAHSDSDISRQVTQPAQRAVARLCRLVVRSLPASIFSFFFSFLLNYFFNCRSFVVIFIAGD